MIAAATLFETLIAARGLLVMRDRDGNLPSGHTAFGPVWALNMPASSLPSDVTLQHGSFVIAPSTNLIESRRNLHDLWQKYLSTLRPDPWFHVPHSVAGLSDAGILAQIKTDETTRPDQIKHYLNTQTTPPPPPFVSPPPGGGGAWRGGNSGPKKKGKTPPPPIRSNAI